MNDLVKLVIDVIKGALKIRPSFEVKEGTKIQEELDGLKEELEKELQNRDSRWNFLLMCWYKKNMKENNLIRVSQFLRQILMTFEKGLAVVKDFTKKK